MANVPHHKSTDFHDGIQTIRLSSWKWFGDYIQKELIDYKSYVFRGQRRASWPLESTLDRAIRGAGQFNYGEYLMNFKWATRGRRGSNPPALDENDWWALGQDHGLHTPLLDWTESPFVALYFAFVKPKEYHKDLRAVWAVSRGSVEEKTSQLAKKNPDKPTQDYGIEIIRPLSDENVNRPGFSGGFFT